MITINKLFRCGELNRWLYWKIDGLFIEDHPIINKLQKNFFWWIGLYTFVYLLVSGWISDFLDTQKFSTVALWWLITFVSLPTGLYLILKYFRFVKFMHYYNAFKEALSFDYFGFDNFLHEIDCDLKHAVFDLDGCVHLNLALQLKNGLLSVETRFGGRAQETPEWLYHRNHFSRLFNLLNRRFHIIAKPKEGWAPYMRLAKE